MQKPVNNILNRFGRTIVFLLFACILFGNISDGYAKKKRRRNKNPWEIKFSLAGYYDDNILKYSDKYLDRFHLQQDVGRFHIDTDDDFILHGNLSLSKAFSFIRRHETKFSISLQHRKYSKNDIKSWSYLRVALRQKLVKRSSIYLAYSYIPDFYVRHFRDADWTAIYGYEPNTFQPYAFSKDNFSGWLQKYFFESTLLRVNFSLMKYFHNEHFTEYDSENRLLGFEIFQPLTDKIRINAGYRFIESDANGFDEIGEQRINADDGDATYEEDNFFGGIHIKLPRLFDHRNSFNFQGQYQKRYYQSAHPAELDKLHVGREDRNYRFSAKYNFRMNRTFDLQLFYNYFYRDTETTADVNREYVSAEKDYRQNQVGLKISYLLKLK